MFESIQQKHSKDEIEDGHNRKAEKHSTMNHTGIPDTIKNHYEQMSGFSFDDVQVHYRSDKPLQMQALAYTQGNQVYLGPGQEKYLSHELGHVVQQKQGRVQPTGYEGNVAVNTDPGLEREADSNISSWSTGMTSRSLAVQMKKPSQAQILQIQATVRKYVDDVYLPKVAIYQKHPRTEEEYLSLAIDPAHLGGFTDQDKVNCVSGFYMNATGAILPKVPAELTVPQSGYIRLNDFKKGEKEAIAGLVIENRNELGKIKRDNTGDAEFIDESNDSKWDVKSSIDLSFNPDKTKQDITASLKKNPRENVILDLDQLSQQNYDTLIHELHDKSFCNVLITFENEALIDDRVDDGTLDVDGYANQIIGNNFADIIDLSHMSHKKYDELREKIIEKIFATMIVIHR